MEAGLADLLGSTGVFGMSAILGGSGRDLVHRAVNIRREAIELGDRRVLFGQRRMNARFSTGDRVPNWMRGRSIADVAADLRSGRRSANDIQITVFEHNGQLVSMNTRGLAALSEAGLRPTNVVRHSGPIPRDIRDRLDEPPLVGGPLPSRSSIVTVGRNNPTPIMRPGTNEPWIIVVP